MGVGCRKIRLIEVNAKCRHLKTLTCKGTLRQLFALPFMSHIFLRGGYWQLRTVQGLRRQIIIYMIGKSLLTLCMGLKSRSFKKQ